MRLTKTELATRRKTRQCFSTAVFMGYHQVRVGEGRIFTLRNPGYIQPLRGALHASLRKVGRVGHDTLGQTSDTMMAIRINS